MRKDYGEARNLLQEVFSEYIDTNKEIKIKNEIMENILEEYRDEGINITLFVKDTQIQDWKPREHFTKIYYGELKYIKEVIGLNQSEKNLLINMSEFLMWETNLLIDEESGVPLTQKELLSKLDVSKPNFIKLIKSLTEKRLILPISHNRKKYYIINPHIMYNGKKIDKFIADLFKMIGYVDGGTFKSKQKYNS